MSSIQAIPSVGQPLHSNGRDSAGLSEAVAPRKDQTGVNAPKFIRDRKSASYRIIWNYLWENCDDSGEVILNVSELARHLKAERERLGIRQSNSESIQPERRTVYRVLDWLKGITINRWSRPATGSFTRQVVEVVERGDLAGHRSAILKLNWKARSPRQYRTLGSTVTVRERSLTSRSYTQLSNAQAREHVGSKGSSTTTANDNSQQLDPLTGRDVDQLLSDIRTWAERGWERKVRNQLCRAVRHMTWGSWSWPRWAQIAAVGVIGKRTRALPLQGQADYARAALIRIWPYQEQIRRYAMWAEAELGEDGAKRILYLILDSLLDDPNYVFDPESRKTRGKLSARLRGLRRCYRERDHEYRTEKLCSLCGYIHNEKEYSTGMSGEETVCFGYLREKIRELEDRKDKIKEHPQYPSVRDLDEDYGIKAILWSENDDNPDVGLTDTQVDEALGASVAP